VSARPRWAGEPHSFSSWRRGQGTVSPAAGFAGPGAVLELVSLPAPAVPAVPASTPFHSCNEAAANRGADSLLLRPRRGSGPSGGALGPLPGLLLCGPRATQTQLSSAVPVVLHLVAWDSAATLLSTSPRVPTGDSRECRAGTPGAAPPCW
jgi:hypothetical protein